VGSECHEKKDTVVAVWRKRLLDGARLLFFTVLDYGMCDGSRCCWTIQQRLGPSKREKEVVAPLMGDEKKYRSIVGDPDLRDDVVALLGP